MTQNKPVIFGIGGLLERGENGKITDLLSIFRDEYGCNTYEVTFADIKRAAEDERTIVCPIRKGDGINLEMAVRSAMEDKDSDMSNIAVVISSMGAVPFLDYLGRSESLTSGLKAYAANVPFTRINPLARPIVLRSLESQHPLDISSKFDKQRGLKRIVPSSCLQYILDFDSAEALQNLSPRYAFDTLTIMASRDERVDNNATYDCHKKLNGKDENLVKIESDHCIPYELSRKPIVDFIINSLKLKPRQSA